MNVDGPIHSLIDRRAFLASTGAMVVLPSLSSVEARAQDPPADAPPTEPTPQEAPDPNAITADTLREAEKLAGIELTPEERAMALEGLENEVAKFRRRREFTLENDLAPATVFDPRLPGVSYGPNHSTVIRSNVDPGPLPESEEDIAFAPVTHLAKWIERREITSERLTKLYLARLKAHGPKLECIVTLTEDLALAQAKRADAEIAAGRYRGPLHGIPWGAKDLLDTDGVATTWGAEPYKERVATRDAAVVRLLEDAGAVLVAKLTLGALAYGDIWFGGRTNNPWNTRQGSSGSSAGSAAATAAGLVGFAIGTETLGSIVSPSMRCGTTGLRPTFGRVPRTGAMALCWSLDKIGPICRTVEDCALVLAAINGRDAGDASSLDVPFAFDANAPVKGVRIGYDPAWFEGRSANDIDRAALEKLKSLGVELVEVKLPERPYDALMTILIVEAASAFEELTLSNRDDELKWQAPQAWPNTFRQTRFVPAIEFLQAMRIRRETMQVMHDLFEENKLDLMFGPSYAGPMLLITNNTGHPCICLRAGFRELPRRANNEGGNGNDTDTDNNTAPPARVPHGVTLWGKPFDEGTLCRVAMDLERALDVWHERPPIA